MKQENQVIRRMAKANGVPHWKISKALGVSEATLTRWLREPLNQDRESQIIKIIERLGDGEQDE